MHSISPDKSKGKIKGGIRQADEEEQKKEGAEYQENYDFLAAASLMNTPQTTSNKQSSRMHYEPHLNMGIEQEEDDILNSYLNAAEERPPFSVE